MDDWENLSEGRTNNNTTINDRVEQLTQWERSLQLREESLQQREMRLEQSSTRVLLPPTDLSTANEMIPRTLGLRDVIDVLPEFNPDKRTSIDSKQFVERVTCLKQAYGWGDSLAVQAKMRGNAKTWADTQRQIHSRWSADLITNFPNNRREADVHIELANTRSCRRNFE